MTHFYDDKGIARHTVIGANGKERPTTIRDARKNKWNPGVTDVIGQLDKPALNIWRPQQLFKAYTEISRQKIDEPTDVYKKRLFGKYVENTGQYSKLGNLVHDKLEKYFVSETLDVEYEDMLWPVIESIQALKLDKIEAEKSFSCPLGYGGTIDLVGYKGEDVYIIDFKTKQSEEPSAKDLYDDYVIQLSAYRNAINPSAKCSNILISVTQHGKIFTKDWSKEEIDRGWSMFECLLKLWKIKNE